MKILVDCRYIGMSGIGRVCSGIIDNLDYDNNTYYLMGNKELLKDYKKAIIIENNTNPYSIKGLLSFDKKLNRECDAFLIPNFMVPFKVKIPVLSVMHDLIFLDKKETTNGIKDRIIKKILLKRGMKKSKSVACVSGFTLDRCRHYYGKLANKCFVNYNGISENILKYRIKENVKKGHSLIYVGNVKPHKGLKTLTDAYAMLGGDYTLKIIGQKDNFLTGLDSSSLKLDGVEFTGRLSDKDLLKEISSAEFLIQPSFYEGFGIPPLEALCLGTKPIISDINVFKEIYKDLPVEYFKVGNAIDLKEKILSTNSDIEDCKDIIKKKYNYKTTARNLEKKLKEII